MSKEETTGEMVKERRVSIYLKGHRSALWTGHVGQAGAGIIGFSLRHPELPLSLLP
jgi:hypothetical protein